MNNPEGVRKMSETKRELSRSMLADKAAETEFIQSGEKLAVSGNRRKRHIGFEEYKNMLADGIPVPEIIGMTSKHIVHFYNALLKGKVTTTREEFEKMYLSGMSLNEIAERTELSRDHVTHLREFYGIKRKGATFIRRLAEEKPLSQEAKSILVGSVLGDGHIHQLGYFSEKHSERQVKYLEWKASFLTDILGERAFDADVGIDKRSGTTVYTFSVRTRAHSFLYELRNKFYKQVDGKWIKIIPDDFQQMLNEQTLAVWFMDDGNTDWKYRHGVKEWKNANPTCKISTQSFGFQDHERIVKSLQTRFNLNPTIRFRGDSQFFLSFPTQESLKLISIIENHCVQELAYKIREFAFVENMSGVAKADPKKTMLKFLKLHNIDLKQKRQLL